MLHGPKRTQKRAAALRRAMSLPEVLLWQELRKRPGGMRFRHQHPAGPYVLDFFCPKHRLAVEVDGAAHGCGDRPERDAVRDAWLAAQGVRVVRVRAVDVLNNLEGVVRYIGEVARGEYPSTGFAGRSDLPLLPGEE